MKENNEISLVGFQSEVIVLFNAKYKAWNRFLRKFCHGDN